MKKILLFGLLSLICVAFSSDAMKRERTDSFSEENYSKQLYYVSGVPKKLALAYYYEIVQYHGELGDVFSRVDSFPEYYANTDTKNFLKRYCNVVISRAVNLRNPSLKPHEVGPEFLQALKVLESDRTKLAFIVTGDDNGSTITNVQWNKHWENLLQKVENGPILKALAAPLILPSSDAMKRELSSDESVEKKVRFADPVIVVSEKFDQIQKFVKEHEKIEEAHYPKQFFYIPGVSRALANKYLTKMMKLEYGFGSGYGDCVDYDKEDYHDDAPGKAELFKSNMRTIRPFVVRYTKTVIKKALSLRSAGLQSDEAGDECEQAIALIHSDKALLSYILKGRKNCDVSKEHLQEKWKQIVQKSLEHQEEVVAQAESDSE